MTDCAYAAILFDEELTLSKVFGFTPLSRRNDVVWPVEDISETVH